MFNSYKIYAQLYSLKKCEYVRLEAMSDYFSTVLFFNCYTIIMITDYTKCCLGVYCDVPILRCRPNYLQYHVISVSVFERALS